MSQSHLTDLVFSDWLSSYTLPPISVTSQSHLTDLVFSDGTIEPRLGDRRTASQSHLTDLVFSDEESLSERFIDEGGRNPT